MSNSLSPNLLPVPRIIEPREGTCRWTRGALDQLVDDRRIRRAALEIFGDQVDRWSGPTLRIAVDSRTVPHRDGYQLIIGPNGIDLFGGSTAGCFYGLQSLRPLVDSARNASGFAQPSSALSLPCCRMEDWPDFASRGLLHDVTRGKVPTLATLKLLVDRLSALKANQLQLYIEHAFTFSFDREICDEDHGLTPDEIRELDEYCRERFVTLVPAVATFGHMGRILSMPRYRHLAEVEPTVPWEQLPWPERAKGFTLDCLNPESHSLVERIWGDILAAFSSPVVNICGDEPWDLGAGKNKDKLTGAAKAQAYVAQIERTNRICAKGGRQTQFWSDIIRNHADLISPALRESTLLHWGYDDRAGYEDTKIFVDAGMTTWVCPGTSGWKRMLNAMQLAERNMATFASAGKRYGASGLLNTDWGDHGHFNGLACSWHAIALGACLGWNAGHATGAEFDRAFAKVFWRLDGADAVTKLREVSACVEPCETWRLFWQARPKIGNDAMLPSPDAVDLLRGAARLAATRLEEIASSFAVYDGAEGGIGLGHANQTLQDLRELAVACRFSELFAEKVAWVRNSKLSDRPDGAWADKLATATERLVANWNVRYKSSGLDDILCALDRVRNEAR